MNLLERIIPNVINNYKELILSTEQTIYMVLVSGIISVFPLSTATGASEVPHTRSPKGFFEFVPYTFSSGSNTYFAEAPVPFMPV